MAKYNINYACGHGSIEKQLYGKDSERRNYIAWAESNMVCPDCYKAKKLEEDKIAEKVATLCLVPALEPIISIEISGQIEENKESLYNLGYRWSDSTKDGLFGYFSMNKPKRTLALLIKVESKEQMTYDVAKHYKDLNTLGYVLKNNINPIDVQYLLRQITEKQEKDEIIKNDPKPEVSPLRKRIEKLEETSGKKWNGKIYGKKGSYNFYVSNVMYNATDAEVVEREENIKIRNDWDVKYK